MKLVAIKSFSYNTRRLNPGDMFEAKDPDGRLLVGVLKARKMEDRKEEVIPEPNMTVLDKLKAKPIPTPIEKPAPVSEDEKAVEDDSQVPANEDAETEEVPEKKVEEAPKTGPDATGLSTPRRGRARKN